MRALLQLLAKPGNFFFGLGDERVELGHFLGVLPLLVLAEAEQVRLVLRPPTVEEELILLDHRLAERLSCRPVVRAEVPSEALEEATPGGEIALLAQVEAVVGQRVEELDVRVLV